MRLTRPILQCAGLVLLIATGAYSQTPDSGSLLEIDGMVTSGANNAPVHLKVYDSQIHTGAVQIPSTNVLDSPEPSNCTFEVPTDAYIVQGGTSDGCDQGTTAEANLTGYMGLIEITSVTYPSVNYGVSNTDYTYTVLIGPDVACCGTINISGLANPANNGTFVVNAVGGGTLTLVNGAGVSAASQSGIGKGVHTGFFRFVSPAGSAAPYEFDVMTNYVCGPYEDGCGAVPVTNTNGNIYSNDSGFLTISNNGSTGSTFSGTIKLSGQPGAAASADCFTVLDPTTLTDTITSGLGSGQNVVLALSNDSSACAGFNMPQTLTLQGNTTATIKAATQSGSNITYKYNLPAGQPDFLAGGSVVITGMSDGGNNGTFIISTLAAGVSITVVNPNGGDESSPPAAATATASNAYPFGNDAYIIRPFNNNRGDTLSVLVVPVPAGPLTGGMFGVETPVTSILRFRAPALFPGQASIPVADFSAANNPVSPLLQLGCTGPIIPPSITNDCQTFLYQSEFDLTVDANSFPGGVGNVHSLGEQNQLDSCQTATFTFDNFFSYVATTPDPVFSHGNPIGCFAATFDPTATAVAPGNTETQQSFLGLQRPVDACPATEACPQAQSVQAGSTIPLIWETKDSSGNPVQLNLCPNQNGTTDGTTPCKIPWVFVGFVPVNLQRDTTTSAVMDDTTAGTSGLQFVSPFNQYNWKTMKSQKGSCVAPVFGFSAGLWLFPTPVAGGIGINAPAVFCFDK